MYSVKPVNNKSLFFEDENVSISYNFWSKGGSVSFLITNKTSEMLAINLERCFFVMNGMTYDYYENLTTTSSSYSAVSAFRYNKKKSIGSNSSRSVTESKVLFIPSGASRSIVKFNINRSFLTLCEIPDFPKKKDEDTVYYTIENSPFVFSNIITYSTPSIALKTLKNEFFIDEISNKSQEEVTEYGYRKECGEEVGMRKLFFKNVRSDAFYISVLDPNR